MATIPSTTITLHNIYRIAARSKSSLGAPVTLHCASSRGEDTEIVILLGDQELANRLVDAVNRAMAPIGFLEFPDEGTR